MLESKMFKTSSPMIPAKKQLVDQQLVDQLLVDQQRVDQQLVVTALGFLAPPPLHGVPPPNDRFHSP